VVTRGVGCSPHPSLKAGCRVRVVRGVLAGVEGTLIRSGAESKLVICVEMIQRSVSVSVDVSDVEPVYREPKWQAQSPSAPLTTAADDAQSRGTTVFQSNS
jgi:hypothetical protein